MKRYRSTDYVGQGPRSAKNFPIQTNSIRAHCHREHPPRKALGGYSTGGGQHSVGSDQRQRWTLPTFCWIRPTHRRWILPAHGRWTPPTFCWIRPAPSLDPVQQGKHLLVLSAGASSESGLKGKPDPPRSCPWTARNYWQLQAKRRGVQNRLGVISSPPHL